MRINKKNALRLWEMCFGDNNFAEDFHGYLMCREGYGDPDYYVCDGKERIYCRWNIHFNKNTSRQVLMRLKASVTIFLSLVITVVIVVVCTVIESARISVSQMEGKATTYMAVESVFAGYGKQLYQDYGILLAWEQEPLGNQVTRYMQDNINMADLDFKKYDFSNIEIESVNILKQKYATDKEGDLFVKQVVDYAKYIVGIDAVNKLISDSEEENNNKETCNEIKEKLGISVMIVDANDLGQEILGKSDDIELSEADLKKLISDNPTGQGKQQTPLILIRKKD